MLQKHIFSNLTASVHFVREDDGRGKSPLLYMIYEFILVTKGWKVDDKSKMKWDKYGRRVEANHRYITMSVLWQ